MFCSTLQPFNPLWNPVESEGPTGPGPGWSKAVDTNGDGSIDFEAKPRPRPGILWDPLGASRYFFIEVPVIPVPFFGFISFYIILYRYLHAANLTLNAGEDSGCSPDGHGRSSWPWCGATMPRPRVWCPHSCDVRCVAIQNTQVPKDPHFCNPSVPFQSGTSNSRKF